MNLTQLHNDNKLKLPGTNSWGGSFGSGDTFYTGDGHDLILIQANGGNSESDASNIIIICRHSGGQVLGRIRNVQSDLKHQLLDFLNGNSGKTLEAIYACEL